MQRHTIPLVAAMQLLKAVGLSQPDISEMLLAAIDDGRLELLGNRDLVVSRAGILVNTAVY